MDRIDPYKESDFVLGRVHQPQIFLGIDHIYNVRMLIFYPNDPSKIFERGSLGENNMSEARTTGTAVLFTRMARGDGLEDRRQVRLGCLGTYLTTCIIVIFIIFLLIIVKRDILSSV